MEAFRAVRGWPGLFVLGVAVALLAQAAGAQSADDAADAIERSSRSGPVEARVRLRPAEPTMGDSLELELEVYAAAGVEVLMPEFGEALGRFKIVDFVPSSRVESEPEDDENEPRSVSLQRYTLAPTLSGPQRIPPLLVEFVDHRPGEDPAPADEDAYELLTDPLDFRVASVLGDGEPLTLRPAAGELAPLAGPGAGPVRWLGGFLLLGLIAVAGFFGFRAWLARRPGESAYAQAHRELAELREAGLPDLENREQVDAFFVDLSGIVRRYIEGRFSLRSPELTTEEFLGELQRSPDLLRSHQALLSELLGTADLVKFAHHTPDRSVLESSLATAERFLEATREAEDVVPGRPAPGAEASRA